jgi:hypothetical protein
MTSVNHLLASTVHAQATNDVATLQDLEGIFSNVISSLLALGAIISFFMLLAGGFKYITSGGNPKAVGSAHATLTYAIIGLVAVAASYLVLEFIYIFTGADVRVFRIMIPN